MNFQFRYQQLSVLWLLLLLLAIVYILHYFLKRKTRQRIGDPQLVAAITLSYSPRLALLKSVFLFLAIIAGILAALNPGRTGGAENIKRNGIDLTIALDVSKSMLATDLAPSRLERARQFVIRLIDALPDDRIALVVFAGKAYLQMPLTTDHGAARLFVASAGPDAVPRQGTVLSEAMELSSRAFTGTDKRFKSIVLISDGEDHDQDALRKARELAGQGIMINTVGVGSPAGSTITDPATGLLKTDESGNTVITKLNEEILQQVAGATNGVYIHLQSGEQAVAELKKQLSQIERKAFADASLFHFRTFFMWFAGAMLLLLVTEIFIPEKRRTPQ